MKKSLVKNYLMNILLTMSSFIFPIVVFPYVSRILQPAGIGKVSFAVSVISYFGLFAQMGIPTYGIRACARVREDKTALSKTVQELFIINMVTCFLSYFAFIFALILVPKFQVDKSLYFIISLSIIFNAISMDWLYRALEQYTYITVRSLIFKIVAFSLMFLMIHKESDYIWYGALTVLASSASNILNLLNIRKYIFLKPIGNFHYKYHIKAIFVFFAMTCATTIYMNLDTVMLGFMKSDTDVGYYDAAVKVKKVLVSVITSLGTVLLPRMSYYVKENLMTDFRHVAKKSINYVVLSALPLMAYFIIFARPCILLISGSAFKGAIMPMQIIIPTLLFIGLSNILGIQILVPLGQEKIVLYSEIAGAIVDILLNSLLIPKYGASGAAFGTLVAELVVLLVQYYALRKYMAELFTKIKYWKIILAVVLSIFSSAWIITLHMNSVFIILLSGCLFFSFYIISLIIMKEELLLEARERIYIFIRSKKQ